MSGRVHIVGGGVIGLCSAWYLRQNGFEVTVVDAGTTPPACSFGNAGMIVPSHFVPLASPGVIAKGLKWMFRSDSPFFIRPRLSLDLMQWLWAFRRSCTPEKASAAMPVLRDLNLMSKDLYRELAASPKMDFGYRESGLLLLCKTPAMLKEETEVAEQAHALGLEASILTTSDAQRHEPAIEADLRGGIFYPGDALIRPDFFMSQLRANLLADGVEFLDAYTVTGFGLDSNGITELRCTGKEPVHVKQVVLAGGSRSGQLMAKLGLRLLVQDGKGYSVTIPTPDPGPRVPAILCEAKVAVSPFGNQLRLGGTLEISNHSPSISRPRLGSILSATRAYYAETNFSDPDMASVWHGFRPCSPDGLPYIGRSKRYPNLTVAAGHAMMGMSTGPATGKLVAELVSGRPLSMPLDLFAVERFG